jgi:hypothetical protein
VYRPQFPQSQPRRNGGPSRVLAGADNFRGGQGIFESTTHWGRGGIRAPTELTRGYSLRRSCWNPPAISSGEKSAPVRRWSSARGNVERTSQRRKLDWSVGCRFGSVKTSAPEMTWNLQALHRSRLCSHLLRRLYATKRMGAPQRFEKIDSVFCNLARVPGDASIEESRGGSGACQDLANYPGQLFG